MSTRPDDRLDDPVDHGAHQGDDHRFVALVAHELLSPLTVIKGWLAVLDRPDVGAERAAQARASMAASADKIERLVRDLLDLSKAAVGELRVEVAPVDLRAVTVAVVAALDDPRVVVVDSAPVAVVADAQRIDQLLTNLIGNGLRHGDGTGVEVALVSDPGVGVVRLTVANGGPAVDPSVASEVFEPFVRGATSAGSGLGLAVCRAIVDAHRGTIAIGRIGSRTVVEVCFPTG